MKVIYATLIHEHLEELPKHRRLNYCIGLMLSSVTGNSLSCMNRENNRRGYLPEMGVNLESIRIVLMLLTNFARIIITYIRS